MSQTKICPDCAAEYFSHVQNCADCGAALLLPEDNLKVQEERKQCVEKAFENPVIVREGSMKWMDELYNSLIDAGIPCAVNTEAGCNKSCCGGTYRLVVSAQDAEKANERIEEYCMEVHPELKTSNELMGEGKCPACGTPVAPDAVECHDCGLILLIVE
jgi:hypothetical protein